ncbi:MAG: efflux RND transporter periplasmic adaptor subunit, partial [Bacteroidota bacterium]
QRSGLAQANTNLAKAQSDYDRVKPLAEIRAVSQAELDGAVAALDAAKASVDASEASLRLSQINLGYTRIASPITGVIGKSLAQTGEYVGQSPNPVILNTVSKTDSLKVEFFLTENDYLQLARQAIIENQQSDSRELPQPKIQLVLSDNSVFDYEGKFRFINREVDPTTGAILIQTIFPNPRGIVKPGQFAKVRITAPPRPNTIIVPQRAVREFQGQFSVFVLGDSSKVQERPIELGDAYRDYYVVRQGLSNGEQILLEGLLKVRSGQVIDPQMTVFESKVPE